MENIAEQDIKPIDCPPNKPHQFSFESGVIITHMEPGRAEGVLKVSENSLNPHGMVHGGALATLADTVGGMCARARGRNCVTANNSMEYLRPASGPLIRCVATPKKEGNTLAVIHVEMRNVDDELVATGTFSFFMFDKQGS